MSADYYQTLGVNKGASAEEIKKAYRGLAHQHHPDKQSGNEAKFKEINEAYQVLSDPKKRQQYDQFGSSFGNGSSSGGFGGFSAEGGPASGWDFGQGFGGFSSGGGSAFGGGGINIEDIFDMFSGGGRGRRTTTDYRGQDIAVRMNIKITEAILGVHKIVEIEKQKTCEICSGKGAKPGTDIVTCETCKGRGETQEEVGSFFGSMLRVVPCSRCQGVGKIPKEPCSQCKGEGRLRGKERLEFDIPSGVEEGAELLLRAKGNAGFRGAASGDLRVQLHIAMPRKLSSKAKKLVEELAHEV